MRLSSKIFPFAPGIKYRIRWGRYIHPELEYKYWLKATEAEEIIVAAYGGLFESVFSQSILELINSRVQGKKLYWCGNTKFNQISYLNGLGSNHNFIDKKSLLYDYPVPIFFDADGRTYFNCLNNYLNVKTYTNEKTYKHGIALFRQLFQNSMIKWSSQYLPKWRNLQESYELKEWAAKYKFNPNQSFVLIIDDNGESLHERKHLDWGGRDFRSFNSLLKSVSLPLVILTNNVNKYYGMSAYFPPYKLDTSLYLLSKAHAVLSVNIDWLLIAMMGFKATVVGEVTDYATTLKKNLKYIGTNNKLYQYKEVTPLNAFEAVKI